MNFDSTIKTIYKFDILFSIFVMICNIFLFFPVYYSLKNVHRNLKLLYFSTILGCCLIPLSNFSLGIFVIYNLENSNAFFVAFNVFSFSLYFIRTTDLAISMERFMATFYASYYRNVRILDFAGILLLFCCIICGIYFGNIVWSCKLFIRQSRMTSTPRCH